MQMFELALLSGGLTREAIEESNHKPKFNSLEASLSLYVFILEKLHHDVTFHVMETSLPFLLHIDTNILEMDVLLCSLKADFHVSHNVFL